MKSKASDTVIDPAHRAAGSIPRKHKAAIAALLAEPTHARAAAKAGVSKRTLCRWLTQPGFQSAYKRARQELVAAMWAAVSSTRC